MQRPRRGRELNAQVAHAQQRSVVEPGLAVHARPGERRWRRPAPNRLRLSTVTKIAGAGIRLTWGTGPSASRPSAIMPPQLGVGCGTPTPRKLSEPSATIITEVMVSA